MKKLLLILAPLLFAPFALTTEAAGQSCEVIAAVPGAVFPVGSHINVKCLQTGEQIVNAAVSASIAGFPTTQSTGTPIAVTTGGVSGTLPTGAVVVATNVGTTNAAYCKLGASATTSDQYIAPSGGWFAFTVGVSTQLTCITSTSTTTVNMVGGSGIPTGTGGGGGGSGGGGAITAASGAFASGSISSGAVASGAVASGAFASGSIASGALASGSGTDGWDVSTGITTATAASVGGAGSVNAKLRLMTSQLDTISSAVQGAIPAGSAIIGKVGIDQTTPGTTNLVALTPAQVGAGATAAAPPANAELMGAITGPTTGGLLTGVIQCDSKAIYDASTSGSTELVALSSGKSIYICGKTIFSGGTANVKLIYGTGTACATGSNNLTPAFQLTAQTGLVDPSPFYRGSKTAVSNALCINSSAGVAVQAEVYYTQF